jgi:allantoicase
MKTESLRFLENGANHWHVVVHLLQPSVARAPVVLTVHYPGRFKNEVLLEALKQRMAGHSA